MQKYKRCLLIVLIISQGAINGQQQKHQPKADKDYTIPFQLTDHNNLSVQAILNKKDTVQLMFHTAADDITLISKSIQKLQSLVFTETTDSVKSWGGQSNSSRLSKDNIVQIGGVEWKHVPIWENTNSAQHTDGKFGTEFFENKVIEIDFDKSIIVVHNNLPKKIRKYEKLPLSFEHNMMFVEANCETGDSTVKNKFLLHSGYAGGILFDDEFTAANNLSRKLKIVGEKELKDSYGNVLKTKKAILPVFQIGKEKITDVPAGFFEGAIGRQKMSVIGGDLLKRFNIIIDAQRRWIYVKASHFINSPYTTI